MKYLRRFKQHSEYDDPNIFDPTITYCSKENEVHFKSDEYDYSKDYLTFESIEDNNTFSFKGTDAAYFQTILVSTDNGNTWIEKTSSLEGTELFVLNSGEKALIKSNTWHQNGKDDNNYNHFKSVRKYIVYGNIASLLYGDNFENQTSLNGIIRTFLGLFLESKLKHSSNLILPFTTCTNICYYLMFRYSGNLLDIPKLPATTLALSCYSRMFNACTNLSTIIELPATTLVNECYQFMFDTTNITIPVNLDHVTQLADYCCRNMYANCQKLTYAPNLPVTILYTGCYLTMFLNCTSMITSPPKLPAMTLTTDCYYGMFDGCSSLISTPELPALSVGVRSYRSMFSRCASLTEPPELPATYIGHEGCYCMFENCTNLLYAPELPATSFQTLYSYYAMFNNCTSLKRAPSILPCTSLVMGCYLAMFKGCINLENTPKLPATTLPNNAYREMFRGCSKINFINAACITLGTNSLTDWVGNVSPTGIFIKNPEAEWNVVGASGIPEGWSVTTNFFDSKIEYLESDGALYLDTQYDISPDNISNMKLYVDCIASSVKSGGIWRVHGIGGGYLDFYVGISNGSSATTNIPFVYGNGTSDVATSIKGSLDIRYKYLLDFKNKIYLVTDEFNNTLIDIVITTNTNISKTYSPYIFAWRRGNNGSLGASHSGKIYSYKLYNDDILVRDFIPVRVGTTGYLYDMVSGLLFGNIGTGNFILGQDIN